MTELKGQPETEELQMIHDYILLPHLLTILQRSRDDIEHGTNTLKLAYLAAADVMIGQVTKELRDLKRELSWRKIKVHDEDGSEPMIIYHPYVCRGYEDRFGVTREVLKARISKRLGQLVGDLTKAMRGAGHDTD